MEYPFEQFDPERFQKFCQALLLKENPDLLCFPVAQPDGGRDAITPFVDSHACVFQIKFTRNPWKAQEVVGWLEGIIDGEIDKVEKLKSRGAKKYYLVTNAQGTSHLDVGSIDKIQELLDRLPLPAVCYWRDDLNRRLDGFRELKWMYPELMTGPDLIQSIIESGLSENKERRSAAIRAFVKEQYERDAQVKFKQVDLQNNLLDLFVDVPVEYNAPNSIKKPKFYEITRVINNIASEELVTTAGEGTPEYIRHQASEEESLGAASLLLHNLGQSYFRHVVLEGAPGQGKSTITQYVCQVHRMRLLKLGSVSDLPMHHRQCSVRLPFRVDLRDFAAWLKKEDPFSLSEKIEAPQQWSKTLESFLAAQVRYQSGGMDFSVSDLISVLSLSSVLLAFDGLDEVAAIKDRQAVVDEIRDGVKRLEANATSLQIVVTSRPAAFENSPGLSREQYFYFQMEALPKNVINAYCERWIAARKMPPVESREVKKILRDKLDSPHLVDLARNPMQLAILLRLIHTRGSSLPDKRTALYDSYVDLFFSRESEKSAVVREKRELLIFLHRYLGWVLHCKAETGKSRGSIRDAELHALVEQYLEREGHEAEDVAALFSGALERVMAIVSRVEGTYEFEVQPLREYFAARYLYESAPYSPPGGEKKGTRVERFDALSKNFYWLNVARFYAGCYTSGELSSLIDGFKDLLESDDYKYLSHPQILAGMLLSDWVFTQQPRALKELMNIALDEKKVRFYLMSMDHPRRPGADLVLPPDAGRSILLDRAFNILVKGVSKDVAFAAIALIHANAGAADVKARWSEEVLKAHGCSRLSWIQYGSHLGYLRAATFNDMDKYMEGVEPNAELVNVLLYAGRSDWLEADELYLNGAVSVALAGQARDYRHKKPSRYLDALFSILNVEGYAAILKGPSKYPAVEIILRYGGFGFPDISKLPDVKGETFAKVRNVVEVAYGQLSLNAEYWATSLEPWEKVVSCLIESFGLHEGAIGLAVMASAIASSAEQCSDAAELFNKDVSIVRRARYARLRSANIAWWERQLESVEAYEESLLALSLIVAWGNDATLMQHSQLIDSLISKMSVEQFEALYALCTILLQEVPRRTSARKFGVALSKLAKPISDNCIAVLILRMNASEREKAICDRFVEYKGSSKVVLSVLRSFAIERAYARKSISDSDLYIFKRCYEFGLEPYFRRYGYVYNMPMDKQMALKVLEEAIKYPSNIVSLAESVLKNDVGRRLVPVGSIAKGQKWVFEG